MNGIIWNISAFIIAIAVLVTFHEWGHFLVARFFKIDVLRFSIGFGKPLCRWHGRKGTEYVISAIPLGGYVKMLDEREGPVPAERLIYAFNTQHVSKRLAVVVAGPLFNFIFAFLAYWLMFVNGIAHPIPLIDNVAPNSIAERAGLKAGDELIGINGHKVESWRTVIEKLVLYGIGNGELNLKVRDINKNEVQRTLNLTDWSFEQSDSNPITSLGFIPYRPKVAPVIAAVSADDPAALAGLLAGDQILSVDGKPMPDWHDFVDVVRASPTKNLVLSVLRDDKKININLTPRAKKDAEHVTGFVGIQAVNIEWPEDKLRNLHYSVIQAIIPASIKTWEMTEMTGVLLYKLFAGFISPKTISGPIGIAQGAGASASGGFSHYLNFLALVSISLAILNLLPIPILDGGHIFYYLIESIRGKPVSDKTQEIGFKVGLLFILALMFLAFYNDISRLLS